MKHFSFRNLQSDGHESATRCAEAPRATKAGMEAVDCPYCQANWPRPWGVENGFSAVKCGGCGLVYVNPRPSSSAISEATRLGQHTIGTGQLDVAYTRSARKIRRYARRVEAMYRAEIFSGRPIRWMDIGAGFGELVEALRTILPPGSEIVGIEPMERKVASAQSRGLAISDTALDAVTGDYDVVSIVNILSHLPDPDAFIARVSRLVRPGGSLYLVTGNGGDLDSRAEYPDRLDLPDHLLFTGERHIAGFLERHGLTVEKTDARRLDTPLWTAKSLVKRALGRRAHVAIPYRSRFRDVSVKARKVLPGEDHV
jgi:2-polyprenyl-3-methyl-5-hydroxy-6-metoxy-1,4-benzoquinol methylase